MVGLAGVAVRETRVGGPLQWLVSKPAAHIPFLLTVKATASAASEPSVSASVTTETATSAAIGATLSSKA